MPKPKIIDRREPGSPAVLDSAGFAEKCCDSLVQWMCRIGAWGSCDELTYSPTRNEVVIDRRSARYGHIESSSWCVLYEPHGRTWFPREHRFMTGKDKDKFCYLLGLHLIGRYENHRSGEAIALHTLSTVVNAGASADVAAILQKAGSVGTPVAWEPLPQRQHLKQALREAVRAYYHPVLQAGSPEEALQALGRFRILCALREGSYGALGLNRTVEELLAEELPGLAERMRFGSYPGKPVMVTSNNYVLKLFNGDTGVFWTRDGAPPLVHFPDETGAIRAIARERLPGHETVYAVTVHKSQGSEFDHVLLVLPDRESPVLTRELLYTGLTRARKSVRILGDESVLRTAVETQARRFSGLADALCFAARGIRQCGTP